MIEARCDIVMPVWNKPEMTKGCLDSIKGHSDIPYRIILIDNASGYRTKRFLEDFRSANPDTLLVRNEENVGWVRAVNQGMKLSKNPYLCIMNNDTVVRTNGWLSRLIEVAESHKDIGLVNPYFYAKGQTVSERPYTEVDFCRGYCMLIKKEVVERIGLLDESYGIGYYDDDDYSMRASRAGFRCVRANGVFVEHLRDSTFAAIFNKNEMSALHEKNKRLFRSKWGRKLRLVFIHTSDKNTRILSDILLELARRQHSIYLWNLGEPLGLDHTNIREKRYGVFLHETIFWLEIFFNIRKSASKRYDAVFTDNPMLNSILSSLKCRIYYADPQKDSGRISEIAESLSRLS